MRMLRLCPSVWKTRACTKYGLIFEEDFITRVYLIVYLNGNYVLLYDLAWLSQYHYLHFEIKASRN